MKLIEGEVDAHSEIGIARRSVSRRVPRAPMRINPRAMTKNTRGGLPFGLRNAGLNELLRVAVWLFALVLMGRAAKAQVNVLTAHNDTARTGHNLKETILTPSNVNSAQFGKLFSQSVNSAVAAQPLYVSQVTIPGNGVHNVVYVATQADMVYAFDADTNGGTNANPLWQVSLLTNSTPAGTLMIADGVLGTPVIDPPLNAIYLVSREDQNSTIIFRLHALDISTGAEKFGGPYLIQGSVPGTGAASVNGVLTFNPQILFQRPGLLLLNGVVYIAFGSSNDEGPWHGWIFSYSAATLQQISVYCTSPNGQGGGMWMGGSGLAGEVYSSSKPYGRMFFATGNGSYSGSYPYTNTMSYGMSVLDLDLTGGQMTVEDEFTPYNESLLDSEDADQGSGGPIILPTQTLASGQILNPLAEVGKSGVIYILDRDNNSDGSNNSATEYSPAGLGGFNAGGDQVEQFVQTPTRAGSDWGAGVWGTGTYWNGNLYYGGTNPGSDSHYFGSGNSLTAYSFVNGVLSSTPISQSVEQYSFPGPTPVVSANGTTNGIVWLLKTDTLDSLGFETLRAYDATNLANMLYSSDTDLARDNPGGALSFNVPTVTNGKVYVGSSNEFSVYGLLANTPTAPPPVISPSGSNPQIFSGTQMVTITDAIAGATIYYTTNGTTPNSSSAVYSAAIPVSANETITAIASPSGYIQSPPASVTYQSATTPANPVFSLPSGTYSGAQALTLSDTTPGAIIYYTVDGTTPTTASPVYAVPLSIPVSETVQAIAIAPGLFSSAVVSANYTIQPVYTIDFSQGFAAANGPMQFNGSTDLDDFRLQLTNGGSFEAGSAFYATPVNIQSFSTTFQLQLSNPGADGMTFTIQNVGPSALGNSGGGLGYATIPNSVAIKFDIYNNAGEGPDSTGMYFNGATPTVPAINLTGSGIDLHSGDYMNVSITYDGNNLNVNITDDLTLATWSQTFAINIPAIVGSKTAYVGFTGGTGGLSSSQKLTAWTYLVGPPLPDYPAGFDSANLTLNGRAALNGTRLRLTNGNFLAAASAFFPNAVNVQQFNTSFDFQITNPAADGFTFTIQGVGPNAVGTNGGNLGYSGIPTSVAVKFDLYNDSGEGPNSTGLYTNGVMPSVPAIDLTPSGINLHSGDTINAQFAYNGTTLTVLLTDDVTGATATQTYSVNIPSIVGGPTAYVGFTAGTGGLSAVMDILDWIYTPVPAPVPGPAFPTGFSTGQSQLTLNGGATVSGGSLTLSDGGGMEARSAFFSTPVNIQQFTTSFNFQQTNATADGFTFTIQGAGSTALGAHGGSLGYGGIPTSVAVKFDLYNNAGEGPDSTGLYLNGATPTVPAINLSTTGINLHSGDIFNALITYNGTTLTVVITDTVTNASAAQNYTVNIPSIVGGPTAYVGFTAGTGGSSAVQNILNWSYSPVAVTGPLYATGFSVAQSELTLNNGAAFNGSRLRLTDGHGFESRSAFFTIPVNVQQFSTSFNFQLTNANADGFTFTIQNVSPAVLGGVSGGGDLGYTGIPTSMAVKFDLYSNLSEGPDSTGLYTDGAVPTIPAINLTSTGINLHSGDIFNAQLTYNGTTLTVVITDTVTNATATETYSVNIPSLVGGPAAYVGFTAADGGLTATQDILSWTYTSGNG